MGVEYDDWKELEPTLSTQYQQQQQFQQFGSMSNTFNTLSSTQVVTNFDNFNQINNDVKLALSPSNNSLGSNDQNQQQNNEVKPLLSSSIGTTAMGQQIIIPNFSAIQQGQGKTKNNS